MLKEFLQGRFMNHPLHPLLVHLPVGLWVASVVFDIAFMANHNPTVAAASFYCICIGLIGAFLALPTGFAEYLNIASKSTPKRLATAHMILNLAITGLFVINALSRYNINRGVPSLITGGQLTLSLLSILLLGVSGYLGGLLVFEFGIGYRPSERGTAETSGDRYEKKRTAA
jgi:uncharacterized membrane protein